MSEAIDLCSSSSDDEARPAAAAAAASSAQATTSTPAAQRKRPRSPTFSDDDDDGNDEIVADVDAAGAVNLSGGSSSKENHQRRRKKKTKRGAGSKYRSGRYDLGGSDSDDSDLPPPSGLHSAEKKKKAGRKKCCGDKKNHYDNDEIVVLDDSDSGDVDGSRKPKAAAARTSDGINSTTKKVDRSKPNKNIEYDEDDEGLGGRFDDGAPNAGASAFDRKKPAAAEAEADVWELLSSSDDEAGTRGGKAAHPTGRSDPRKVAYDSSNDDHVDRFSNGRKRSKAASKRGDSHSDSDVASHASMDSFDRLELEAKERSKKDTKKTAKTKSKKTKDDDNKKGRKVEGSRRYLTSADATLANVQAMLRSDSEGGPPSDDDMHLHFDDDDDDDKHLQVPTAAAAAGASSSTAKTPAKSGGNNSRFSSDNGNGMFSPSSRIKVKVPDSDDTQRNPQQHRGQVVSGSAPRFCKTTSPSRKSCS